MSATDVVALLEATYGLEGGTDAWLKAVAGAAASAFGVPNVGAYAVLYDASDVHDFRVTHVAATPGLAPATFNLIAHDFAALYRAHPALTEAVFRKTPFGPGRDLPMPEALQGVFAQLHAHGIHDILGLNGVNPDGRGLHVGVLVAAGSAPTPIANDLLARVSSHLGAGYRLYARLTRPSAEEGDAVIGADGKVEHAVEGARLPQAREALADAARAIERARGAIRKRDPERAVAQWKALVDARWSLVDRFERDGKHYLVAHRNDPPTGAVAELSERERQVTALAAVGHANKMIAYELGIAVSTVGVLLGRAARRLGVKTRAELIAAYEAHANAPASVIR
jgi:DNA-binding CsgD family transcriptional regulator